MFNAGIDTLWIFCIPSVKVFVSHPSCRLHFFHKCCFSHFIGILAEGQA